MAVSFSNKSSASLEIITCVLMVLGLGIGVYWALHRQSQTETKDLKLVSDLVSSEERILELTPKLRTLKQGLLNLKFPNHAGKNLFAANVTVRDLANGDLNTQIAGVQRKATRGDLSMWEPLLERVQWLEQPSFYFVNGHFPDDQLNVFEGVVGFKGLAKMKTGEWRGLSGKQVVTWKKQNDDWLITEWQMKELKGVESPGRLFEESLNDALPRPADYSKARRSIHQEAAIAHYLSQKKELPHPYFAPISANQKPGISVVDIEGDGDDDIYVTVRMGENLLLENQGNGTFLETAEEHGIHFNGHGTCSLFADFDNDGDPDLLLGRSLRPSVYFENVNGQFQAREQKDKLPMLVVSMSASDFNGDGLLDFYLLTYRPATIKNSSSPSGGVGGELTDWPDQFFEPKEAAEYHRRYREANGTHDPEFPNLLNQIGPQNYLYVNRGNGKFEIAPENAQLGIWRNSLQATWSDFDEDGDPDVYIANDWAADSFFRNDGEKGFTDITGQAGTTAFGFAMGASWGDYDNDGSQDLYVSNMFSKAGQRITSRVAEEINSNYIQSAAGNYLYRQSAPGKFDLVSGLEKPKLQVANGGWSWGGQFADFNNDGFLDIYTLSGYFTAPPGLASEVDL